MISVLIAAATLQTSGIDSYLNIQYATIGDVILRLDIHVPQAATSAPTIVWIHGGGWQSGSRTNYGPARALQQRHPQFAIASISYRFSQTAIFPAQLNDCKTAIAWLKNNAAQYRLNPNKFAVWGSSAGGHLAALVAVTDKWPHVSDSVNQASQVKAAVDYYGPTDFITFVQTPGYESHALAGSAESKLLGGPVLEFQDRARAANPITYVSKNDPPFFIVHGVDDSTVPKNQSELLAESLRAVRVPNQLTLIPQAGHGGVSFTQPALLDRVAEFLTRALSK